MIRRAVYALAFASFLVACRGERESTSTASTTSPPTTTESAPPAPAAASQFDLQFIDAMRKHHELAVQMAKLAAERATDAKIRAMATKMAADQEKEIAQLTTWREQWYAGAPPADTASLPGAASMNMDTSHMQSLSGHQFEMMFVDMMLPHHEGAIAMACAAHAQSGRAELKQFARGVIRAQEQEVSDLSSWKQTMGM